MFEPILVVGCGRSGTTLIYQMLCCHPELGWFSNFTDRWGATPILATGSRVFPAARRHGIKSRFLPTPSEAYPFWNDLSRIDDLPLEDPLTEHDVTPTARSFARTRIESLLRYQWRSRFINKATRNTRRLRYVDALLDEVRFINVIRDPRATVASLLKVPFWAEVTVWSEGHITPREWEAQGNDPADLAARLWVADVARCLEDKESIPADRYFEVHYESLIEDPRRVVSEIAGFAELPMTRPFARALRSFAVVDENRKFETQLSRDQLGRIRDVAGPLAERLGYML